MLATKLTEVTQNHPEIAQMLGWALGQVLLPLVKESEKDRQRIESCISGNTSAVNSVYNKVDCLEKSITQFKADVVRLQGENAQLRRDLLNLTQFAENLQDQLDPDLAQHFAAATANIPDSSASAAASVSTVASTGPMAASSTAPAAASVSTLASTGPMAASSTAPAAASVSTVASTGSMVASSTAPAAASAMSASIFGSGSAPAFPWQQGGSFGAMGAGGFGAPRAFNGVQPGGFGAPRAFNGVQTGGFGLPHASSGAHSFGAPSSGPSSFGSSNAGTSSGSGSSGSYPAWSDQFM